MQDIGSIYEYLGVERPSTTKPGLPAINHLCHKHFLSGPLILSDSVRIPLLGFPVPICEAYNTWLSVP